MSRVRRELEYAVQALSRDHKVFKQTTVDQVRCSMMIASKEVCDLQAENRKLARWLECMWHRIHSRACPVCGRARDIRCADENHLPGCEFAAWLGSRDRKEQQDAE